jgi:glycine/D-amino acid oxidase-like deaminating enzyme
VSVQGSSATAALPLGRVERPDRQRRQPPEEHFDYRWAGRIAITRDFMPHVHTPAPGVTMALGYSGRGIALATSMGRHLAARLTGDSSSFPYPVTPMQAIPLHGLQRFYVAAGVAWYSLLDRLS